MASVWHARPPGGGTEPGNGARSCPARRASRRTAAPEFLVRQSDQKREPDTTCRYCFRPATALLQDMPLCATHMSAFVRHVGGPAEVAGLSPAPVQHAADKHFRDSQRSDRAQRSTA